MRDATQHERDCINKYLESISIKTGNNFWDLVN